MRRWVTINEFITADRESLQRVTIYPEESNKEHVKSENRKYNYTRLLLVPEKAHKSPKYIIRKMSRV